MNKAEEQQSSFFSLAGQSFATENVPVWIQRSVVSWS